MREMQKAYDELQTVITPEQVRLEERTREKNRQLLEERDAQ
jgi:hypothetical protein